MPVEYRGFFFTVKDGDYFRRSVALLVEGLPPPLPQVSQCGICGGQSVTGKVFLPVTIYNLDVKRR
jgi:hypothetical protein